MGERASRPEFIPTEFVATRPERLRGATSWSARASMKSSLRRRRRSARRTAHDSIERRLLAGVPAAGASRGQADRDLLPLQERRRRPARTSVWLRPVPRQATHGRRETTVGKKTATGSPLPRQGIQHVFASTGGPRAVTSSSSSSRGTNSCACIRGPICTAPQVSGQPGD